MDIKLKNVKHSEFASHETDCFQASVYIDGKKAGTVINDGQGGPNYYEPHRLYETLSNYCDVIPTDMLGNKQHPDEIIGNLFESWYDKKKKAAMCRGKTVYRIHGFDYKNDREWHMIKAPFTPNLKQKLLLLHGSATRFLNEEIKE